MRILPFKYQGRGTEDYKKKHTQKKAETYVYSVCVEQYS